MSEVPTCDRCNTPLDEQGACVTCRAQGDGLVVLSRSGYTSVREVMEVLEKQGLAPEIEQVPPRRPEERFHPLWNLCVPQAQAEQAARLLREDWAEMLLDAEAARAAARGITGVDLDAGGEIECPACGHRFVPGPGGADCPDCGLALGAAAEASPEEAEG